MRGDFMSETDFKKAGSDIRRVITNVTKAFIGKEETVEAAVLALFSEGHVLLEDVPGVGKTLLAKSIAKSINADIKRVQFTADLLPSDISGTTVYNSKSDEFSFRPGPVFTNILLGDEINRATPRTQSSLLEAMEENQVTADGSVYKLEAPFFVIATQNPIELEGTYPLPFSQMDRFIIRLKIGYLAKELEKEMLATQRVSSPLDSLKAVMDKKEILGIQNLVRNIRITDELQSYIVSIVTATRESGFCEYGASPRGSLDLMRYSQALALLSERDFVLPDDIKKAAPSVLGHRIIVRKGSRLSTASGNDAVSEILENVEVPL